MWSGLWNALGSECARKFQCYHFWLWNSVYISVLTSLTLGFQFLNRWEWSQNKSTETTRAAVKLRGMVSEGSETPTRELACRPGQAGWWSWLSVVRWEPRHLTSLLCRKRHSSKTNQMAQQVRALLPSLATWVGSPGLSQWRERREIWTLSLDHHKHAFIRWHLRVPWSTCVIAEWEEPLSSVTLRKLPRHRYLSLWEPRLAVPKMKAPSGPAIATVHHSWAEDPGLHYMASEIRRFTWSSQLVFLGSKRRVVVLFSSHWLCYFWKSKWPIRRVAIFHGSLLSMKQYFGDIPFQLGKPQVCSVFIF